MKSVHDLSNLDLLREFSEAAIKLGQCASGMVFDPMLRVNRDDYAELKAAVLARMEGRKPPFKNGSRVRAKEEALVSGCMDNEVRLYQSPRLVMDTCYTVHTCRYLIGDTWWVALKELKAHEGGGYFFYDAKHLELAP